MRLVWIACLTVTTLLSGCVSSGTSSDPSRPAQPRTLRCPPSLRDAFSQGAAGTATTVASDVTAGFTTCDLRRQPSKDRICSAAAVTINTNPQALKNFQRWVDETAQNASTGSGDELAPHQIDGIGVEADWVPGTLTFETATNSRWIAIRLTCASAGPESLALAKALARAALTAR